ncbi:hypothetical protein [Chlamydiifrater phoenicopteri]|uniref:hypothetical protein n=1 Tax=Chlamydiifrater phoenicopteri TaxID=2681469 RepID=UPI001BCF57F0|nr:hypothetical protein [Chlamydiifrater phoenicopteri]
MVAIVSAALKGRESLEKIKEVPPVLLIGGNIEGEESILLDALGLKDCKVLFGDGLAAETVSSYTESYGFLSAPRSVAIFKAEGLPKATVNYILKYAKAPNKSVSLCLFTSKKVFYESLETSTHSLFSSLSLFGEWTSEKEKRVIKVLQELLKERNVTCAPSTLQFFLTRCGDMEFQGVKREFEKLLCAIGDKESLETTDVSAFTDHQEKLSLWVFRNALFQGSRVTAAKAYQALCDKGEEPLGLIAFLRSQCLYGLKGFDEKASSNDKKFAIYIDYGKEALVQALSYLFYAEGQIKSGIEPSIAMTMLISRMTK